MCIESIGLFELFSVTFMASGLFLAGVVIHRTLEDNGNFLAGASIVMAFGTAGVSLVGVVVFGLARGLS